jgi:hypothetical protein
LDNGLGSFVASGRCPQGPQPRRRRSTSSDPERAPRRGAILWRGLLSVHRPGRRLPRGTKSGAPPAACAPLERGGEESAAGSRSATEPNTALERTGRLGRATALPR